MHITSRRNIIGFTIVELLIVVVVVGILAAISLVTYSGIQQNAAASVLRSDLKNASTQLDLAKVQTGAYPFYDSIGNGIPKSEGTLYEYSSSGDAYCLSAVSSQPGSQAFHISSSTGTIADGLCDGHSLALDGGGGVAIADGSFMQIITKENCPTTRTLAVDARDNHSYWVQKLADGECWMLTNLAYGGGVSNGGVDTYGDVKEITHNTSTSNSYGVAYYHTPSFSGSLFTVYPTEPSIDITGGSSVGRQYGYLYNFCAAMGRQTGTSACLNGATPLPDPGVSICPAGWRLPSGEASTGEFTLLNNNVNNGLTNTDLGLREIWLMQRAGFWNSMHFGASNSAYYWSGTQLSATSVYAMIYSSSTLNSSGAHTKQLGAAVRCVAA